MAYSFPKRRLYLCPECSDTVRASHILKPRCPVVAKARRREWIALACGLAFFAACALLRP